MFLLYGIPVILYFNTSNVIVRRSISHSRRLGIYYCNQCISKLVFSHEGSWANKNIDPHVEWESHVCVSPVLDGNAFSVCCNNSAERTPQHLYDWTFSLYSFTAAASAIQWVVPFGNGLVNCDSHRTWGSHLSNKKKQEVNYWAVEFLEQIQETHKNIHIRKLWSKHGLLWS